MLDDIIENQAILKRILPDGRYVTIPAIDAKKLCDSVSESIRDRIETRNADELPRIILAFGKCRVGSTALSNAIGRAGISSFFQPFKSALRQALCGQEDLSYFDAFLSPDTVYCKEMFGPYTQVESAWNPFLSLLEMGYPADKLTLVWLERDPFDALTSWVRNWAQVVDRTTLVDHFELASKTAAWVAAEFEARDVQVLRFNYDSLSATPDAVFQLLKKLNVQHENEREVLSWGDAGDLASDKSTIHFTREPAAYGQIKVHSNRSEYRYVPQSYGVIEDNMRTVLQERGLFNIYKAHKASCVGRLHPVSEVGRGSAAW